VKLDEIAFENTFFFLLDPYSLSVSFCLSTLTNPHDPYRIYRVTRYLGGLRPESVKQNTECCGLKTVFGIIDV